MNQTIRNSSADDVRTVPVGEIVSAPINVHAVETADDPEFKGLVASVKANGIIHRILVREYGGKFQIIDGHRRYHAAKAAGLQEIPAEVLNADAARAAVLTVATNIQRRSNDPILEAELIVWLSKRGLGVEEIAAELGKSASYVATRAKLTDLTEPWRGLAKRCKCTTDLLVKVARFSPELQDAVAEASQISEYGEDGQTISWDDFEYMFSSRMHYIKSAPFDTEICLKCPHNTATQRFLFPEDEDPSARCECSSCYISHANAAVDAEIERLRADGTPAVEVMGKFYVPESWNAKRTPDDTNTQAYVYPDGPIRCILWSVPKTAKKADAKTAEERKAEREAKKAQKELEASYERARETVNSAIRKAASGELLHTVIKRISRSDAFSNWAADMMMDRFGSGCETRESAVDLIRMCGGISAFERAFRTAFPADECKAIAKITGEEVE